MESKLKILLLEDSLADAELIRRFLEKTIIHCEFRHVIDRENFIEALDDFRPGLILSDNSMPMFSAGEALTITRLSNRYIPFIMVTGTASEEFAASIIKQGADDYIIKDRMSRLPAAIDAALKQRRAEKEISDYKYALDQASLVSLSDKNGLIQYVNNNFCRVSGYRREALLGQDHRLLNAGHHAAAYFRGMWNTILAGKIWKGEFCNRTKDGDTCWIDATIVPFLNNNGKPYQFLSMATDITERKRIEEELESSTERFKYATAASSDLIWEFDFDSGDYRVYEGKEKFFGFDTGIHWEAGDTAINIAADDRERVRAGFREAKDNPSRNLWKAEYRICSLEQYVLHITNHAIFIRNSDGRAVRAIGAITDITEKKILEAELFEQHRKEQLKITATALDAQEKERNAIGQELHDNVNQILLGTKLLLSVVKNEPDENLYLLESCIRNLQNAIDENRKIAHILVVPDFQTISLIDQLMSLTESMLKVSGIDVTVDSLGMTEKELPVKFKLPIYRIAQEQCTNIVKYSEARAVTLYLETNEDFFRMTISDNGVGMDVDKLTTGIGLKNIKGRLSVLNGSVDIITAPGRGFTLDVTIPF